MIFIKQITKNKVFEIKANILKFAPWFSFELYINFRSFGDHLGFFFHIAVSKLWFEVNFYNVRHEQDTQISVVDEDK